MVNLLNQRLFDLLQRHFGAVTLSNQGETAAISHDPANRRTHVTGGEYYLVRCPFCGSDKKLYFNYLFGTKDRWGNEMRHLAICYKDCLANTSNFQMLMDRLFGFVNASERYKLPEKIAATVRLTPSELPEVDLPGQVAYQNELSDSHPMIQYFAGRGISRELLDFFQVGYCHSLFNPERYGPAFFRAIIPFYLEGRLVSWQARSLNGDDQMKYYTCPGSSKSQTLFNIDNAKKATAIVVVEGALDCFKLPNNAVAIAGKSISNAQIGLLKKYCFNRPIVVAMDGEAQEETGLITRRINETKKLLAVPVYLPTDMDPGDFEPEALKQYILAETSKPLIGLHIRL